jgi:branched-chain amino acid transport system permease protein
VTTKKTLIGGVCLAALALLPLAVRNPYVLHLLIMSLLWILLGQSWNLLGGYTGQVSFGHAAFFGVGAYTSAILFKSGFSPAAAWSGLVLGGIVAALLALVIGWICFRLRGPYFALSVLALSEVLRLVAVNWKQLTNGAEGILYIPAFTSKAWYYWIILALAAVCFAVIRLVMRSKLGFYFLSIREDQDCAESLGIDTTKYKLYSLLISAFFTGVAGSFYMNYMGFIDPGIVFSVHDISVMMILVTMLGGVATTWGPAVGAAIYILMSEVFRTYLKSGHLVFFGLLIIVIIIFFPQGIVGTLRETLQRRKRRFAAPPAGGPLKEAA